MRVSPLQPQGHVFEKVEIEVELDTNQAPISAKNFDFGGVSISCDVGHADLGEEDGVSNDDSMIVALRLRISNTEGAKCPYRIDIKVTGAFKWLKKDTPIIQRKDLTVVNGASLLYGTIREMVLNISSRSVNGPLLLPSLNFEDNRPSLVSEATAPVE